MGGVTTLLIVVFGIFVVVVYLARILLRIARTISSPRKFTEVSDDERKRSE